MDRLTIVTPASVGDSLRNVLKWGVHLPEDEQLDASVLWDLSQAEGIALSDQFHTIVRPSSRALAVFDTPSGPPLIYVADIYVNDVTAPQLEVRTAQLSADGLVSYIETTGIYTAPPTQQAAAAGLGCSITCGAVGNVLGALAGISCGPVTVAALVCYAVVGGASGAACYSVCGLEDRPMLSYYLTPPDCTSTYSCGIRGEGYSLNGKVVKASNLVEWAREPTSVYSTHSTTITWVATISADQGTFTTFSHASASGVDCAEAVHVDATVTDRYGQSAYAAAAAAKNRGANCPLI